MQTNCAKSLGYVPNKASQIGLGTFSSPVIDNYNVGKMKCSNILCHSRSIKLWADSMLSSLATVMSMWSCMINKANAPLEIYGITWCPNLITWETIKRITDSQISGHVRRFFFLYPSNFNSSMLLKIWRWWRGNWQYFYKPAYLHWDLPASQ